MTFERHKMNKRVINDLKKRSTIGIPFYILIAFCVVFAEGLYKRQYLFSIVFLLSMMGICLFRLIHLVISSKISDRCERLNTGVFFASVIVTALIWGTAQAQIMLQQGEYMTQALMTVSICGLCAAGVVAFIPNRQLSIIFNLSMLMPAAVAMLVNGLNTPLVVLTFLYSFFMVLLTFRGNKEYWEALENEYLLEIKSQELVRLSNTDVLTGLYNRRYFDEAFEKEWNRSERNNSILSIILFDIDHFKNVNDTFGHQVGDEYLKKTAENLNSVFKRDYDIVARYGGEEFIVLLAGINADYARQMAENVRKRIETMTIDYRGKRVMATISAGIMCCVPDLNTTPDSIMSCADQALYLAKHEGRNRVAVYTPISSSDDMSECLEI